MSQKKVLVGFSGNAEHSISGLDPELLTVHAGISMKISAQPTNARWSIGGTSVNLAIGLKRHGGTRCRLLLAVGETEDVPRAMLSRQLTDFGVDFHMFPVREQTGHATVLGLTNGTTLVVGTKGEYLSYPIEEVKQQASEFAADAVVATGVVPADVPMATAMFEASGPNAIHILNPRTELAGNRELLTELLLRTQLLVINEVEAAAILGRDHWIRGDPLIEFHERYAIPMVIVTCGPDGAVLSGRGSKTIYQPAVDCGPVVDTTGAGDSFLSGFLSNFLNGDDLRSCLRFAATSAGITVTRHFGSSIPTREEIEAITANQR